MVISIDSLKEPVGSIKPWIRPNTSTPIPVNWLICDGSTVSDPASSFNGLAIPDFRAHFARGHNSLTNANFGSDVTYFTGSPSIPSGGTDANNLSHQHGEGSHSHSISFESPGTNSYSHNHTAPNGSPSSVNNASPLGIISTDTHSHTVNSHAHGGGTGSASGSGTSFNLGSTENRPVFTEYVHIIKIK